MSADNKKPFETASATTDPDNSSSGPFAYVITGVCLILLVGFGLLLSSCVSIAMTASATSGSSYGGSQGMPYGEDLDFDDFGDIENWLDQYAPYGDDGMGTDGTSPTTDTNASIATVDEILDFQIAPYGDCIDDTVSASSYAGTPSEVRDFVRQVVTSDRDYTSQVTGALNAAATDEASTQEKVREAVTLCEEASKAINDIAIPELKGDSDGSVADTLGTAKTKAQERWDQMGRELALLDTTETVETRKLWNYDEDVQDATEEAGELLERAMEEAASL